MSSPDLPTSKSMQLNRILRFSTKSCRFFWDPFILATEGRDRWVSSTRRCAVCNSFRFAAAMLGVAGLIPAPRLMEANGCDLHVVRTGLRKPSPWDGVRLFWQTNQFLEFRESQHELKALPSLKNAPSLIGQYCTSFGGLLWSRFEFLWELEQNDNIKPYFVDTIFWVDLKGDQGEHPHFAAYFDTEPHGAYSVRNRL